MPARGLIPPGLLGHESTAGSLQPAGELRAAEDSSGFRSSGFRPSGLGPSSGVPAPGGEGREARRRLCCALHECFRGVYAPFWRALARRFERAGVELDVRPFEGDLDGVDLVVTRWIADYADADAFASCLEVFRRRGWFGGTPSILELARRARRESDPGLRHALYRQIEDLLRESLELLPLFHENVVRLARPEVRGLRLAATFPEVRYEELFLEPR